MSTREDILVRLEEVLGNITGITSVYRDRGEMPIEKLPAAVLLDGSEVLASAPLAQRSADMAPAFFILSPQVFIILQPRDDMTNSTLNGEPAPVGPELSAYRDQVLAAVINDSVLASIVTRQIVYRGCDTDMQSGSSMIGQLQMHFDFHYMQFPLSG